MSEPNLSRGAGHQDRLAAVGSGPPLLALADPPLASQYPIQRAPVLDRRTAVLGGLAAQKGRSVRTSAVTPVSLWMSQGQDG